MSEVEVIVKDGKAQLVTREGQLVAVPVEQAGQAIADGARPADEAQVEQFQRGKKYGTIGQKAITGVEGFAEGATHGLSTAAAVELGGEEYRQDALGRAEANPITRAVAGVGGAIAGTLATGGIGGALAAPVRGSAALGRGAAGLVPSLGTGTLARAGTAALRYGAQGGVEGAAFGLGSSLAESALEGVDWTADSALAGMRDGAFYGLVGGAALGGVGSLVGSGGRRVLESMTEGKGLKTAVQEFADGRILKGLSGNDAKFWRAITRNGTQPERIAELSKKLREWGVTTADDKAGVIAAKLEEARRQLDEVTEALSRVPRPREQVYAEFGEDLDEFLNRMRGEVSRVERGKGALVAPEKLKRATELKERVRQAVEELADEEGTYFRGAALGPDEAAELASGTYRAKNTWSLARTEEHAASFAKKQKDGVLFRVRGRAANADAIPGSNTFEEHLMPAGKTFRVTGTSQAPDGMRIIDLVEATPRVPRPNLGAMGDEIGMMLQRLRASGVASDIRIARQVERQVEPFFAKFGPDTGNVPTFADVRTFKQRLGKAQAWHNGQRTAAAEEMNKLYGIVARNLDDAAEEAGPELASAWKAANRDADDLRTLADSIKRKSIADLKNRYISPSDYGTAVPAGIVASMLTGSPIVGAITTAVGSVVHKLIRERGSMAVGRLANWAVETEQRTRTAARVIAGLEKAKELPVRAIAKATSRHDVEKQYNDIEANVNQLDGDPDAVANKVAKVVQPIADEQPEVAIAMSRQLYDDLGWLKSKLPQKYGRATTSLTPTLELSQAKPSEMKKIVAYAAALADPISVLEDFAEGNLDWYGIEALKERRPERFEAMREQVMAACAEAGRTLSYPKRVMLGVAFDFVSDPSLLHTADLQATWEARDAAPPTGGPRGPGRPPKQGVELMGQTPFQKALAQ